ncbi:MAG: undecaprenyldiphospho-muramoylpentapeptide beta-N-acetylglucosaminyltransferase [Coriobacteriales bacterium]|jgi:UDP-N-acetylglucosamine--N-acetylmuramyl-(pentapeptide) pyrophosphoryl-undecaprenol N-acetylglucosamine transferase|nr:undecaprenyldiphospho-muramoylpentapeptide beta-N-acetylglucosaminyltransferase [Coriobacteriales bacterium]
MKIVVTSGGTAGHVNPALAVAQELREAGHELVFAGTPQGLEARLVPAEGFDYVAFKAAGFNRRKPLTLLSSSFAIAASAAKARTWLRAVKPSVVVGFGGYVSIPVGLAASWLGIPLAIHEQNSTSGMANRFLAKRARLVALTYASAAKDFKISTEPVCVGNPVRASLLTANRAAARASFGIPPDATVLLAFGGSLGAQHINEALVARAAYLLSLDRLHILHVTGTRDFPQIEAMVARIGAAADRWHLIDYCDRMGDAYAAADAVLSRAGATTLAEIGALGIPALLVPYPHAAADEQTANARVLVEAQAADMVADGDLDGLVFTERLARLVTDEVYRGDMRRAARALGGSTAREDLARLIIALG